MHIEVPIKERRLGQYEQTAVSSTDWKILMTLRTILEKDGWELTGHGRTYFGGGKPGRNATFRKLIAT